MAYLPAPPTSPQVDVLVGTPGRLAELLTDGCLRLDFCRAAVCDEVDVLLGEGCKGCRGRGCMSRLGVHCCKGKRSISAFVKVVMPVPRE